MLEINRLGGAAYLETPDTGKPVLVANRCCALAGSLTNGTDTAGTYRIRHTATDVGQISDIQFVDSNTYLNSTGEEDGPNAITLTRSVEYPAGTFRRVTWNGQPSITVQPGVTVTSDPLGYHITGGDFFWSLAHVSVASAGMKWPVGNSFYYSGGEKTNRGVGSADLTAAGGTMSVTFGAGFFPVAIIGRPAIRRPTWAIIGSSSAYGQGETGSGDEFFNTGYLARAMSNQYGVLKMARPSDTAEQWVNQASRRYEMLSRAGVTHVLFQYGSNDISNGKTSAAIKANLLKAWSQLAQRGYKVFHATATPSTTSSDAWATVDGQTRHARNDTRVAVNAFIREMPQPLAGVFDVASVVETDFNSGLWRVTGQPGGFTADGLHCSNAAHALIAQSMNLSRIR